MTDIKLTPRQRDALVALNGKNLLRNAWGGWAVDLMEFGCAFSSRTVNALEDYGFARYVARAGEFTITDAGRLWLKANETGAKFPQLEYTETVANTERMRQWRARKKAENEAAEAGKA